MKALLREHRGKDYVWMDATYNSGLWSIDGRNYLETDVVSVADDDRSNLVKCSACGEYIPNDPQEIEKHRNRFRDINTCLHCGDLYTRSIGDSNVTYERLEDGNYERTTKTTCGLYCARRHWYHTKIGTDDAYAVCRHAPCFTATMENVSDIFTKYPGVFDDLATVDKILEVGYKSKDYDKYGLYGENEIYARVNHSGIVDYFVFIDGGGDAHDLVYSKKYDKVFCYGYSNYSEWNPSWLPEETKTSVKNQIAELYH